MLTVTLVTLPDSPLTVMSDGYGLAAPLLGMMIGVEFLKTFAGQLVDAHPLELILSIRHPTEELLSSLPSRQRSFTLWPAGGGGGLARVGINPFGVPPHPPPPPMGFPVPLSKVPV